MTQEKKGQIMAKQYNLVKAKSTQI